jgi:DNA-directed RNA polymerase beta subunit
MKKGDKISNRYGAKGVVTHVIEEGNEPVSESLGKLDTFIAPSSVLGRKNTSIFKELYIGKVLYLLPKILSKNIKNGAKTSQIKKTIYEVYNALDTTNDKEQTKKLMDKIQGIEEKEFRQLIENEKFDLSIIVPPFTKTEFQNVKKAGEILDIEFEEYVYLPEFDTYTKTKVPVGIQYMSAMEQTATDYESTRSQAGYQSFTGQPTKGKNRKGGQSIGNMDIYSLLTYDSNDMLNELLTVRSDDVKRKRMVLSDLRKTGQATLPPNDENKKGGKTKETLNVMMLGLGLELK